MGTATVITSNALTDLEDDVTELTTKLNGVIIQYNKVQEDMTINKDAIDDIKLKITNHKGKIDTLITDMTGVKNKITSGYTASQTTGGGSNSDAILERLSNLDQDFKELSEHYQYHVTNVYDHGTYGHDSGGRSGNRGGGGGIGVPTDRYIDITAASTASTRAAASSGTASGTSSGTGADTSVNADPTTGMGLSYSTAATKVITIGTKGEIRGKRLARQTLNRLRK